MGHFGSHQSTSARPDEKMGNETNRGYPEDRKLTSPQNRTLKRSASKKRRQRDRKTS